MPLPPVTPSKSSDGFQLERSLVILDSRADEPDDRTYWLRQPPELRLAGIEFLRRQFYSYDEARREFRRFLEITQRPGG